MVPTLNPHVREAQRQSVRVLLIDDDQEDAILLEHQLAKLKDFDVEFVWTNDVRDALHQIRGSDFDVLFVDYRLGNSSGMGLMSQLLEDDPQRAVVMVTGFGDENARTECLRRGAIDYLSKSDLNPRVLYRCIKRSLLPPDERTGVEKRLNKAIFDPVTGVYRLPTFLGAARQEIEACRGSDCLQALLIVDVDNFRGFVQASGAAAGETVLREVAAAICNALPKCDMVGRYGEDKFCVLAQIEDRWIASELAEHIRAGTERNAGVTVSVGVACTPAGVARINDLISSADAAKYNAQQEGRNRTHITWRR